MAERETYSVTAKTQNSHAFEDNRKITTSMLAWGTTKMKLKVRKFIEFTFFIIISQN